MVGITQGKKGKFTLRQEFLGMGSYSSLQKEGVTALILPIHVRDGPSLTLLHMRLGNVKVWLLHGQPLASYPCVVFEVHFIM